MFKTVSRLHAALAVLLICLFLPICVPAEETASQVYIAVDQTRMCPLAGAIAYQGEQSGASVSMYSIYSNKQLYSSIGDSSMEEALQKYDGGKLNSKDDGIKHLNNFLTQFADQADFSAPSVEVYLLTGYARDDLVFGGWKEGTGEESGEFSSSYLKKAYDALCTVMDAHPQVRLHFYYKSYAEPEGKAALDAKLQEKYPDRVTYEGLPSEVSDAEIISQALTRSASSIAPRTLAGKLNKKGEINHNKLGLFELLSLTFTSKQQPVSVSYVSGEAAHSIPAYHEAQNNTFWLYLPEGTQSGAITVQYESDVPEDAAYTLNTWTALPELEYTLLDAQNQPVSAEENISFCSEETRWTLELHLPGFMPDDIKPSLSAVVNQESETVAVNGVFVSSCTDGSTCRWTYALAALAPNSSGTLNVRFSIWDQTDAQEITLPFTIANRTPELAEGIASPVNLDVYFEVPGVPSTKMTYNLSDYFLERDAIDELLILDDHGISYKGYSYSVSDGILAYEATEVVAAPTEVTVTATDKSNASVSCQFIFTHNSVDDMLGLLRMEPDSDTKSILREGQFIIPIGQETTLRFVLPADAQTALRRALDALGLPALEDCIEIYVNDAQTPLILMENGDLALSYTLPAFDHMGQDTLTFSAQFACVPTDSAVADDSVSRLLTSLFPAAQYTLVIQNNPPRLKEGVSAENDGSSHDIDGMRGRYTPVKFSELFGSLMLNELFENPEPTEAVTYTIQVSGGSAAIQPSSDSNIAGDNTYTFSSAEAAQALEIELLEPGEYRIEITARDTEQTADQTLTYTVTLKSSFVRCLIIGIVVAVVLIIIIVVALIIRRKMMPSFDRASVVISCQRTELRDSLKNHPYTNIRLDSYGKDAVSLMTLLVASGQLPPRNCAPEVLTHISFTPDKQNGFRVSCSGEAADGSTELYINGSPVDGSHCTIKDKHTLSIRFSGSGRSEVLTICMYKN